jgi:hypothetical protein
LEVDVGVLVALFVLLAETSPDASRLAWMEGRWSGQKDGVVTEEHWTSPAGGVLLGVNKSVKAGRLVSFEFLRIEAQDGRLVYLASPRSAPPTPFRMTSLSERRVVFENPAHDFPQRILYWLDEAGALHARIEGRIGNREAAEEWVWRKVL